MKTTDLLEHISKNAVIRRPGRGSPEKGIDKSVVRAVVNAITDVLGDGFESTFEAHVKTTPLPKKRGRPPKKAASK